MALPDHLADHLISISHALAGHTDPGEAFRASAQEVAQLICYDHIDIALMMPDRRTHLVYEVGPKTSWSNLTQNPLPIECSPARLVLQLHQPYLLAADALTDNRFHFSGALNEPIHAAQLRSRIIVPMRSRGDIVGSLNISRQVPDCYTFADVEVAQICADVLTPYIVALIHAQDARRAMLAERRARKSEKRLRRGASQLTETMDRENRRLAMDLHDQTLGDLAHIARRAAALRSAGSAGREDLAELENLVSGCLTEVRRIVDSLQPNMLQLFGLRDAIEAHLSKGVADVHPPIAIEVNDLTEGAVDSLADPVRTALYRIAQEGINNAVRHSGASHIDVTIARTERRFSVTICDNGRGIGPSRRDDEGGLSHMQTRASLSGAFIRWDRPVGGGTRVVVEVESVRHQWPRHQALYGLEAS